MTREDRKKAVSDEFIYLAISDAYSLIDKIYNDFEQQLKGLQEERMSLWMLLDNIDTAEDIAKSDDKLFRGLCRNEYPKRWAIYEPKDNQ